MSFRELRRATVTKVRTLLTSAVLAEKQRDLEAAEGLYRKADWSDPMRYKS